ncbi:MAG TPA: lipoxygenase family protein [Pyrinomonadaceae bacterium]|jgi:arachidonate 15-lipoxygenase
MTTPQQPSTSNIHLSINIDEKKPDFHLSVKDPATEEKKYKYNYTYLPPLAMVDSVAPEEDFSARPQWVEMVGFRVVTVLLNTIMVGIEKEQGIENYLKELMKDLKALSGLLEVQVTDALLGAIVKEFEQKGFPRNFSQLEEFMKGAAKLFASTLTADALGELAQVLLKLGTLNGRPQSVEDYARLFELIPVPEISSSFENDATFAAMRVAGPNPVMIEQVKSLEARFPVTNQQYLSAMNTEDDDLQAALAEGRLFLADYAILGRAVNGSYPSEQKYLSAPLALFAVPKGGKSLQPVAIQCGQDPATNRICYPNDPDDKDGYNWLIAKTFVQIADGNFHEAVSHLGRTHLFVEPFVIAAHNQLQPADPSQPPHPIYTLLHPHFVGTLAINNAAQSNLISAGGTVDKLLSGTIDQSRVYAVEGAQSYLLNVNNSMLPKTLAARGFDSQSKLSDYPYRDDALLLWGAINEWVSNYVNHYYQTDNAVENDQAIQMWVSELLAHDGGRMGNIGNNGKVETRASLIDLLTMVIFTASAQHAAVNYPQDPLMSYAPAMPLAAYTPPPAVNAAATEQDFLNLLPSLSQAQTQLNLLFLLGSVYYTTLGNYGDGYFTDPQIQTYLSAFQARLTKIEQEIQEANQHRTPYTFLLPSKIPQSINI